MSQMKEQNKTLERELNKMETNNLLNADFKTLVTRNFFYYDHLVNFSLYAGPTFYYTFKKVETKRMHNEGTKNNKWKIALSYGQIRGIWVIFP